MIRYFSPLSGVALAAILLHLALARTGEARDHRGAALAAPMMSDYRSR